MKGIALCLSVLCGIFLLVRGTADAGEGGTDKLIELAKARVEIARKSSDKLWEYERRGLMTLPAQSHYVWSRRWLEAQLDLANTKDERATAYQGHLDRMTKVAQKAKKNADTAGTPDMALEPEFYRNEAEAWLVKEKGKK